MTTKPAAAMGYRMLGRSGIRVSEICLGTMMFGGPTSEPEAQRIVDHAYDPGVNFMHTADGYTDGHPGAGVGPAGAAAARS